MSPPEMVVDVLGANLSEKALQLIPGVYSIDNPRNNFHFKLKPSEVSSLPSFHNNIT